MDNIKNNLEDINKIITEQSHIWNLKTLPKLLLVSKRQNIEKIKEAISIGQVNFSENQVQEAESKWLEIIKENPKIKLHLIGHLQSNKVKNALQLFHCISSIDSEKLAKKIKDNLSSESTTKEFLIQINIGEEKQKNGILPKEASGFINYFRDDLKLPLKGLMCIPPQEKLATPYFIFLKKIARENNIDYLSMGMSSDFKDAIRAGTNEIRIGTKIFEKRE